MAAEQIGHSGALVNDRERHRCRGGPAGGRRGLRSDAPTRLSRNGAGAVRSVRWRRPVPAGACCARCSAIRQRARLGGSRVRCRRAPGFQGHPAYPGWTVGHHGELRRDLQPVSAQTVAVQVPASVAGGAGAECGDEQFDQRHRGIVAAGTGGLIGQHGVAVGGGRIGLAANTAGHHLTGSAVTIWMLGGSGMPEQRHGELPRLGRGQRCGGLRAGHAARVARVVVAAQSDLAPGSIWSGAMRPVMKRRRLPIPVSAPTRAGAPRRRWRASARAAGRAAPSRAARGREPPGRCGTRPSRSPGTRCR